MSESRARWMKSTAEAARNRRLNGLYILPTPNKLTANQHESGESEVELLEARPQRFKETD